MAPTTTTILLVDDDDGVLDTLGSALGGRGYACLCAHSAESALALTAAEAVDLAIVDIRLPGLDGIELTRRLKAMAADPPLPVLLITGDATREPARGLDAGGDDYMTKPLGIIELEARVRGLLARRRRLGELARDADDLRGMHRRRRDLAALLVHDLRNPLSALQGNLALLREEVGEAPAAQELLRDCDELTARAQALVSGLLDVEELEEGRLTPEPSEVVVAELARRCSLACQAALQQRGLGFQLSIDDDLRARFDRELVGRMLENLLDNAVRYAPRDGRVVVAAERSGDEVLLCVGNDGPAVPDDERARIFDRYYRIEARRGGARANRGLGLYFCRLAAEAHGGTIDVEARLGLSACFVVRLPQ